MSCDRCGQEHERCSAHTFRDGQTTPCRKFPIKGARVCATHGGSARQVKAAAAANLLQVELLAKYPRRAASSVLLEALHMADGRAREAAATGAPNAMELADRAADLARTVVTKLGPDFEDRLDASQARLVAGAFRAAVAAARVTDEQQQVMTERFVVELRALDDKAGGS